MVHLDIPEVEGVAEGTLTKLDNVGMTQLMSAST
jgi:hypothetical protein